jgi:putative component of membrane protein insertase Oxa1/YidC/SpoIIIJ protein YidD
VSAAPHAPARQAARPTRRWLRLAGLLLTLLLVLDWARPPARQLSTRAEIAAITRYQRSISPWLQRGGVRCRFTLSCSHYATAALARDGFVAGNLRTVWRLLRCGPWTRAGTVDPP